MVLLETIPDTPSFGKEIQMIQLGCFIVLVFVWTKDSYICNIHFVGGNDVLFDNQLFLDRL